MIGVELTIAKFRELSTKLKRKTLVQMGNAGTRILLKQMKAAAPVSRDKFEPGLLRRSLGRRVKVYRSGTILWAGAGPRVGFKMIGPPRTRGERKGEPRVKNPTKYGRLANVKTSWATDAADRAKAEVFAAMQDALQEALKL